MNVELEKEISIKYQDYEDYTQRKYTKINEHLNIFESVSQMTEDRELDSIVLNTIKLDELNNKNNKTNDKYKDIYDFIFRTKGSK